MKKQVKHYKLWAVFFMELLLLFSLLLFIPFILDKLYTLSLIPELPFLRLLASLDEHLHFAPKILAGVLGIAIIGAAIIVELAANRYTSKAVDLFIEDKTSLHILGLFIISCLHSLWAPILSAHQQSPFTNLLNILLLTASFMLIMPYGVHLFHFLKPGNMLQKLGGSVRTILDEKMNPYDDISLKSNQYKVIDGIGSISDIGLNEIHNNDRSIVFLTVDALEQILLDYIEIKKQLPPAWFSVSEISEGDPDFMNLTEDAFRLIERRKLWFDRKVLNQLSLLYRETLEKDYGVNKRISMALRRVGVKAALWQDYGTLDYVVSTFSLMLYISISSGGVQPAYNALFQYRIFAEALAEQGLEDQLIQTGENSRFYGQLADRHKMPLIHEFAAFNLGDIIRRVYLSSSPSLDRLLEIFLAMDRHIETGDSEHTTRIVRKAQAKLAAFFLNQNAEHYARTIFQKMKSDPLPRLISIKEELVEGKNECCYLIDPLVNLYFMDTQEKIALERFFSWFAE
ncbi:DUF2254 domain-containing protein [bacterium]|nr:DUF2254 domain-containing protein [bacterium]